MSMLHVHSCYQFYDSAITIESLVEKAVQYGLPYVALCDANFTAPKSSFHAPIGRVSFRLSGRNVIRRKGGSLVTRAIARGIISWYNTITA